MRNLNGLTDAVIGAAMEVHRALGQGLLESTYEMCLCRELAVRGIPFERQVPIAVEYKGVKLDCEYRADIIVDSRILVEIKAIDSLLPVHDTQLLTYLKLNFNVELLKHGLRRRVLGLQEEVTL
ncbi:MAG TPA: GxxExxY protein [Candidatus Udaeobacter sp.]|nr:GxxExxY protein [Candidatus Udaeobacter sp.]